MVWAGVALREGTLRQYICAVYGPPAARQSGSRRPPPFTIQGIADAAAETVAAYERRNPAAEKPRSEQLPAHLQAQTTRR